MFSKPTIWKRVRVQILEANVGVGELKSGLLWGLVAISSQSGARSKGLVMDKNVQVTVQVEMHSDGGWRQARRS